MTASSDISVAYLVNIYPKISHSFIQREIQALEDQCVAIRRFSIRRSDEPLVDAADQLEAERTVVLLDRGPGGLLADTLKAMLMRPIRFLVALRLAIATGVGSDRGLIRHLFYLAEACALLGYLRKDPVDHVHAHFGTNSAAVAMLCASLGGPGYSFTAHGTESFEDPARIRLPRKAARATFVVTVSEQGRHELIRVCPGIDPERVFVVRCGLDDEYRHAPGGETCEARRLAIIARMSPEKGHEVALEAAAKLHEDGVDFEMVLVGDGELRSRIEAIVRERGLGQVVRLAGWQDRAGVQGILRSCRALVVSSRGEGLPVVIMEAMALGRPVISTDVGGISELVVDGETGRLVPAGDAERLAAAMRDVLEAPAAAIAAMGNNGRQRVLRMHDARVEAARLKALFLEHRAQK